MFQKTHQKQEPMKNTKLNKIMGTNNEGNIPHTKHMGKKQTKYIDHNQEANNTWEHNNNKTQTTKTTNIFKLLWLRSKQQTTHGTKTTTTTATTNKQTTNYSNWSGHGPLEAD